MEGSNNVSGQPPAGLTPEFLKAADIETSHCITSVGPLTHRTPEQHTREFISEFSRVLLIGGQLDILVQYLRSWSQATFGSDETSGPAGALKHLEKEAREAREAWEDSVKKITPPGYFREELADCFLLILDAARRGGVSPIDLIRSAHEKMDVNRQRKRPTPTDDNPVEHVR